jgi:hypothetical protein
VALGGTCAAAGIASSRAVISNRKRIALPYKEKSPGG